MEGLADADHIQAGLVGQLLYQRRDLLHRLAVDIFLAHSPVNWQRKVGMSGSRQVGNQTSRTQRASRDPAPTNPNSAPLTVFRYYSWHGARARVHVYYDSWVPSGEVGHFTFHELPARRSEGEYGAPNPVPSFPAPPFRSSRYRAPHLAPRDEGASRLRLRLRRCSCCT